MQKVIYTVLSVLILTGLGFAINYYKKLDKCKADLEACEKIPDFTPALFNVKEFIGARKKMHFKIKCSNGTDFNFFDTNKCEILIDKDVSNEDVTLIYDEYNGTIGGSSYIVDWLEYWNFSIDLSDSNKWKIKNENKTITFDAPQIKISRLAMSGKDYLLYSIDRAVWSNDQKALVNIAKKTNDFALIKANKYLTENYTNIKDEMKVSIEEFIKTLISKLGYPENYNILVNFDSPS